MSFQAGDIVYLKSGGPAMTIRWINQDECVCDWFINNQDLKSDRFLGTSLTKENPNKKPVSPPLKSVNSF